MKGLLILKPYGTKYACQDQKPSQLAPRCINSDYMASKRESTCYNSLTKGHDLGFASSIQKSDHQIIIIKINVFQQEKRCGPKINNIKNQELK